MLAPLNIQVADLQMLVWLMEVCKHIPGDVEVLP